MLYEAMEGNIVFSAGDNNYTCKYWNNLSPIRIDNKDILVLTTQIYDEDLYDFIDKYKEVDIDYRTKVKNISCGEEEYSLTNTLNNMRLILYKSTYKCDSLTEHVFVFGSDGVTKEDVLTMLNQEMKEEIIDEVISKLLKHMGLK